MPVKFSLPGLSFVKVCKWMSLSLNPPNHGDLAVRIELE